MGIREILGAMEADADAEEARIAAEARTRAEALVAGARADAAGRRDALLAGARADARSEASRSQAAASVRIAAVRSAAREEVAQRVFDLAAERLARARDLAEYPAALHALFAEALEAFDPAERVVVRCDPMDETAVRALARGRAGVERVDPTLVCWGGLVAHDAGDRVVSDDTLESRLARARERLWTDVAAEAAG